MQQGTPPSFAARCRSLLRSSLKSAIPQSLHDPLRNWLADLRGIPRPRIVHLPTAREGRRRIVVDAEPLRHRRAGIGTYTYELMKSLLRLDPQSDYYLMNLAGDRSPIVIPRTVGAEQFSDWLSEVVTDSAPWQIPPPALRGADLYLGPCFFGQFHPSFRTIITIHDTSYRYYPEETCPAIHPVLQSELPRQARLADAIITISESTRTDVLKFLPVAPEKVRAIHLGVHPRFRPLDSTRLADVRARYRLPDRFILSVGTLEPRKNLIRLCEAFRLMQRELPDNCALVLTGNKGWKDEAIRRAIGQLPPSSITLTGYVPDDDLPALYNLADVLVYPSLYEGFGLPVVEAMACGTPVITSNCSSLPEVSGSAAVLVDPLSVEAIAQSLSRVWRDDDLRASLRRAGFENARRFVWEETGRQVLALFDEVLAGRTSVC